MRIAYYSPLPPEQTGIAAYSELLLPALESRLDVTVVPRGRTRALRGVDLCVYQVGNNPDAHGWILDALRQRPGLVVLHDVVLHHLVAGVTLARGLGKPYLDAMHAEAGVVGRLLAHGVVDGVVPPLWETRAEDFPLTRVVTAHAQGVVVHSAHAEEWVRRTGYAGRLWRIPHPAWKPPAVPPDPDVPGDRSPVIGCIGHLTPSKRLATLFAAFAHLKGAYPNALLVLAGQASERGMEIDRWLVEAGLEHGRDVRVLGYVPEGRLWSLLAAFDVVVALRWPSMGETSGTAIRALAAGRPLVVTDAGWFGELPDEVAEKVAPEDEPGFLARGLAALADDEALRLRMGRAARAYAERELDLDRVAQLYLAAIEETAGAAVLERELLTEIGMAAQAVGMDAFDPELKRVVAHLKGVGYGD